MVEQEEVVEAGRSRDEMEKKEAHMFITHL
jgi:hypothetical protein